MTTRFDVPALLSGLTIEEKAALCSGSGFWHTRAVERLDVPNIMVADGPHGLRKQTVSGDDVGMGLSVPATCFPTAAALASSWDTDLLRRVGAAVADEARAEDVGVVLGPGINIKRSPLCGRNFEYLSEDPVLSGDLGAAIVDGLQSRGVGASLKHYAVNNQETDRLRVSADVDDRALREIYLAGFERVVKQAKPWTVMCSYNRINGVYASQDHWLLTEVLREEWGFDGLVVSDWGAVDDNIAAVAAGLDLEMPSTGGVSAARLVHAVRDGELDESVLDLAVERVLQLLDRALPGAESDDTVDLDANHALARAVGSECVVLLKNEPRDGTPLLPLAPHRGSQLAVIGELARTPRFQGAGSSKVNPYQVSNPLDEVRAVLAEIGDDLTVDFAEGYGVDTTEGDEDRRIEAVALARSAATVVLFLGLPASAESEGFDRTTLDLPPNQIELLEAVAAVNDRLVVVLSNGSVVSMAPWVDRAGAVLEGWLLGQAGGGAVADVLVGRTNPSGRLAETIPLRLEDTPCYLSFPGEDSHVRYGEGIFVGYRHYDAVDRDVAFAFGHGLSYTSFDQHDLTVTVLDVDAAAPALEQDRIEVTVSVTNTGSVAGKEVVQVYVADTEARVARPVRELKAFAKVDLSPGETKQVTLRLTGRDLAYWSTREGGWKLEGGEFSIDVGASSRDIRQSAVVEIDGGPGVVALHPMSTLQEWIDHPVGSAVLREALTTSPSGDLSSLIDPSEFLKVVSSVPLNRMILMVNAGFSPTIIDDLLAAVDGAGQRLTMPRAGTTKPTAAAKADDRRRQSRGDARRQQILDAAVELFSATGYRSTGLAQLADTVDMTNPGLLYYFGTKERLLLEVVAERGRIERELRDDLDPATLGLATLTDIARQNVENAMLTRLYVVLAAESLDARDPLHDFFVQRYDGARRHVAQLLRHSITTGELRDDIDATQLGHEVLAILMGLELQWLMDPDAFDLVATVEAYVDSLRARLAPDPQRPRRTRARGTSD